MDAKIIEKYKKAGEIAKQVKAMLPSLVKEGALLLDIANVVEKKIKDLGGEPAFPLNISINEVAAHYVPALGDDTALSSGDLVKFDLGVHIDGYIVDTAVSYSVGESEENDKLIAASVEALNNAIKILKPGIKTNEIGKVIDDTITSRGFKSIKNLSGHNLERYDVHAGLTIPNFDTGTGTPIEEGMVFALEPFATTGFGKTVEGTSGNVFELTGEGTIRQGREILDYIKEEYHTVPFAKRDLVEKFGALKTNLALKACISKGIIFQHKTLVEQGKGKVSQTEHTIMMLDKPVVLT